MSAVLGENRASLPVVSVVMPCLNEERTITRCVQAALCGVANLGVPGEVVVSDNGSIDNSAPAASAAGARVVHCPERGYGHAIRCGVRSSLGRWIVMGDADGSYDFTCLQPFVERLAGGADLVIGNRFQGGIAAGAMPWKNRYIGNPILTTVLNSFHRTPAGDSLCGLRAFSREAFELMQLETGGMEFASEMLVNATMQRLTVTEVPVTLSPDGRGRPPHLAPWSDGLRILRFLLRSSGLNAIHSALLAAVAALRAIFSSLCPSTPETGCHRDASRLRSDFVRVRDEGACEAIATHEVAT